MPQISVIVPVYNGEEGLSRMLDSLRQQTFRDYEVWIINDGSTDRTQPIAEAFAKSDARFHVIRQENQGVSAARNCGMENACGSYIIFFDGDDWIPPQALEALYQSIRMESADMAVGMLETVSDGKAVLNQASRDLAVQKRIDPADPAFIKTWSQCNKLYRRAFLQEHEIQFLPVKVAEDGQFLYQVLTERPKICGCDALVYRYFRKPFWEGLHTASKKVERVYLTDRLEVYDDMLRRIKPLLAEKTPEEADAYRDRLVTRFIRGGLIQAFYRRIWRCEENLEPDLAQAVLKFWPMITEECRKQICWEEWDVAIAKITKGELVDAREHYCTEPEISFLFSLQNPREISLCMESLLNQELTSFEVFLEETLYQQATGSWKKLPNVHTVSKEVYEKERVSQVAKGRYVCWIDTPVIFPVHALKHMLDAIEDSIQCVFVSAYIQPVSIKKDSMQIEYQDKTLTAMEAVFGPLKRQKLVFQKSDWLDNRMANKLFRRYIAGEFPMKGMPFEDLIRFYRHRRIQKIRNARIMTDLTDQDLLDRAGGNVTARRMKMQAVYNRAVRWIGHRVREFRRGRR